MTRKKTTEEFKREVFNLCGDEYTVLSEYKGNKVKILIKHNCSECNNYEWEIKPNNFLSLKQRCPICSKSRADNMNRRTLEDISKEIHSIHGDEYIILSNNYLNNKSNITIRHNKCGCEFETNANNFISKKSSCPICAYNVRKNKTKNNIDEVSKNINDITNGEYKLISTEYINNHTPIEIQHIRCGRIYKVTYGNFVSGEVRCPCITTSKGEIKVEHILNNINVAFKSQHTFKDCKGIKRKMPFDFYLEEYNLLIEYQGRQHYEPVDIFGGEESFKIQVRNDEIKRKYCLDNKINLLEICYKDFDKIEKIIKNNIQI